MFEGIYNSDKRNIKSSYHLYKKLISPINKNVISGKIYKRNYTNENYDKVLDRHYIKDNDEESTLYLYDSFIKIETNKNVPSFISALKDDDIFVCDFENKDYFWISSFKNNLYNLENNSTISI